eukprot:gnl/TRDRNA2_/TRDRNA2_165889_c0_seq1.p1 gnl/TRDRNA2_/TRDRNA2_165889_c0~~gnl/TRDRNA2_/TRDRNA2_165889_c0_seq1.p1  ORF type:complete len:353 (+),score=21.38 gnl/TRDRNA2_/TRDRNA2_165889_c0_seq1:694-1752(+)
MGTYALIMKESGSVKQASDLLLECWEMRRKTLGDEHLDTLWTSATYGGCLRSLGVLEEATDRSKTVWSLYKKQLGTDHPQTLWAMGAYAQCLTARGDFKEAISLHRKCFEMRREKLGGEHPDTLWSMMAVIAASRKTSSDVEAGQQDMQTLVDLSKRCWEAHEHKQGPHHPVTLSSMGAYAQILSFAGQKHDALKLHEECFQWRCERLGETNIDTLWSMHQCVVGRRECNNVLGAESLGKELLRCWGKNCRLGAESLDELLKAWEGAGDGRQKCPQALRAMGSYAVILYELGKLEDSLKVHQKCRELREQVLGMDHHDTLWSQERCGALTGELKGLAEVDQTPAGQKDSLVS